MHIDLFCTSFDVCCFVVGESNVFIVQCTQQSMNFLGLGYLPMNQLIKDYSYTLFHNND